MRIGLPAAAELGPGAGEVVVKGGWGTGTGLFGRVEEASTPGPMSLAIGPRGEIAVLDQVNRRLLRFDAEGRPLGELGLPGETAEDLVLVGDRLFVLFYEPDDAGYRLRGYRADGSLRLDLPLSRSLDLVTGLFASGSPGSPDLWVEQSHEDHLQVVAKGEPIPASEQRVSLRGRPHPSSPSVRLQASLDGPRLAVVDQVFPGNYTSRLVEVETPLPLLAVDDLAVDGEGGFYLSVIMGEENEDPDAGWKELRHVMVVVRPGQAVRTIELLTEPAADAFRTLAVGRDGAVHQLEATAEGVAVRRWRPAGKGGAR